MGGPATDLTSRLLLAQLISFLVEVRQALGEGSLGLFGIGEIVLVEVRDQLFGCRRDSPHALRLRRRFFREAFDHGSFGGTGRE